MYLPNKKNMLNIAAEYWKPPIFQPPVTPSARLIAALRRFFDLQAGSAWGDLSVLLRDCAGTLVDAGCGGQPFRPLVPGGVTYIGIDTADAEARFGYKIPDTIYFEGTAWPLDDAKADTILCTETLEHVLEPTVLLREAQRCLRPGGKLVLTVPFSARWHYIPYDYWRYTPSSLEYLLKKCGFADIVVYARGNAVTVACYKFMSLITPLFFPQRRKPVLEAIMLVVGLLLFPLYLLFAIVGNLSLSSATGEDCLGYTAIATRTDETREEG
jgi:SAM-dependent methyltransferase